MADVLPSPALQFPSGVLVADGELSICAVLHIHLTESGMPVWSATNGPEAIELYRSHASDIGAALLEVELPGLLDGPQTLAGLRALRPGLPCCFMSAGTDRYTETELLALGAARIFPKPFQLAEVTRTLSQLITRPERRRATRDRSARAVVSVGGHRGYVRDTSAGGLALWLRDAAEVGAVLTLQSYPTTETAKELQVEVRHCRPDDGGWVIGCRFVPAA